jgi:A/G-specific adenine glycosylase
MSAAITSFAPELLAWFRQHGRHDLPWQHPRSAYRVWVAEVMLQQTQVVTVIPYFERFVTRFPDLASLAAAELDEVLALWSGLGYYSRARNLHRCAVMCVAAHSGQLPDTFEALSALPGIGRSTAGAMLAQAHGQAHPILDGNVRRVLARYHAIDQWPGAPAVQSRLWALATAHTPERQVCDYTQAIMDLGATVCTRSRPACGQCPLAGGCAARAQGLAGALPIARPRRVIPDRHRYWLLINDEAGRILLERRPPRGIWGGLWSFPEQDAAPVHMPGPPLAEVQHSFTHFRLHARVVCATLDCSATQDRDTAWFGPAELHALALPAPVRRLLLDQLPGITT